MNTRLLKKVRRHYRLIQTRDGFYLFEQRLFVTNLIFRLVTGKEESCMWFEASIGSLRHGTFYKTRRDAIDAFQKHISEKYHYGNYRIRKIHMV